MRTFAYGKPPTLTLGAEPSVGTVTPTVGEALPEFVCAMSNLTLEAASKRIAEIQRVLEVRQPGASISVGLAELCDNDTLESLVARADAALYAAKTNRDS